MSGQGHSKQSKRGGGPSEPLDPSPSGRGHRRRGPSSGIAAMRRLAALLGLLLTLLGMGGPAPMLQAADRPVITQSRNPSEVRKLPPGLVELTGTTMSFQVPERLQGRARELLPQAEAMREELLEALLPLPGKGTDPPDLPDRRWVIRLAEDDESFRALQPGEPPPWAAGVAWPSYGLAVIRTDRPDPMGQQSVETVLRHELVHLLLSDLFGMREVPRWFDEGVARLLAREASVDQWVRLSQAVVMDALIPFRSLEQRFPLSAGEAEIAYAQSREFLRWLIDRFGPELLPGLVQELRTGQDLNEALWRQTRYGLKTLERQWQDQLESSFAWISALGGGMTLLGGLGSVLLVLGWRRRKQQSLARHAQWDEEEAQELALREAWERMERAARLQRVQAVLAEGAPIALYNGRMVQPRDLEQALLERLRRSPPKPGTPQTPGPEDSEPAEPSGRAPATPDALVPSDDTTRAPWPDSSSHPAQEDEDWDEDDASQDADSSGDDDETPDEGDGDSSPSEEEYPEQDYPEEDEETSDSASPSSYPASPTEDEEDPDERPPPGGWLH